MDSGSSERENPMRLARPILFFVAVIMSVSAATAQDGKVSIEELVSKHLQSIGKTTKPTSAPRLLQGKVVFSEIIGRNVHLEGASSVLSQGRKFKCSFQFGLPQYLRRAVCL